MIKLQIHNDHKKKHQSFEASLNEYESDGYQIGYGSDKEEAIMELRKSIESKIRELQSIDFENFDWISWDGRII